MKRSASTFLFGLAAVTAVVLIGYAIFQKSAPSVYDEFAQCLTDTGVKMYGAWWCPHCANQKELFGSAFDQVTYVECSTGGTRSFNVPACQEVGVGKEFGVPLWVFPDGSTREGEQSLRELAEASGCILPTEP